MQANTAVWPALIRAVQSGLLLAGITLLGIPQGSIAASLFPAPPLGLRVTQFSTGVDYPTSMTVFGDGSLLVGETTPSASGGFANFYFGSGKLVRMTDTSYTGVADGAGTIVASGLAGAVTSVRQAGSLIVVATTGNGGPSGLGDEDITFLRPGATPVSPYTNLGSVHFHFPSFDAAVNIALDTRLTPGSPGSYDIFFSLGAGNTTGTPVGNVSITGLITAAKPAGSLYKMTVDTTGNTPSITSLQQMANGIRNSGGVLINQTTGDVYFGDNGYEDSHGVPVSADELNLLTAAQIASNTVTSFGYPGSYTDYATGVFHGGTGVPALAAFRATASGAESFGLNELAFAPSWFPPGLNQGIFGGFDGNFNLAGPGNNTNPVVYVDPTTGMYSYFIAGGQSGIGHLIGLASTGTTLFLADLASTDGWNAGVGAIYELSSVPEPASLVFAAAGLLAMAAARLRERLKARGPAMHERRE